MMIIQRRPNSLKNNLYMKMKTILFYNPKISTRTCSNDIKNDSADILISYSAFCFPTMLNWAEGTFYLFRLGDLPWDWSGGGYCREFWEIPHHLVFIFLYLHQPCFTCSRCLHCRLRLANARGSETNDRIFLKNAWMTAKWL